MVHIIRKVLFVVFIITVLISCKEKIFTGGVNCDDCYIDKPDYFYFTLNVTLNDSFPEVPVLIYKGKSIENGEFIDTFICFIDGGERFDQAELKAEEYYSAKAIYKNNKRTVYVVDGINHKLKRVSDQCEEECWVSENDVFKLQLVY